MSTLANFRLKVFRKVAEQLSFRKAAEELYLTQPAITSQIHTLEEELSVQLFDRAGKSIALTPSGTVLLEYVRRVDELLAEAEQQVASLQGEAAGELAIGASTTIAQYVLPKLLERFNRQNPRIRLRVTSGNTDMVIAAVLEQRIALGLIEAPARRRDLRAEPFMDDELVLIVPPGHEWSEGGAISIQQLVGAPLLFREHGSGSRRVIELALEKNGLRRKQQRIEMELDSTEAIKSAVEAGLGIGFVSRWALGKEIQLGTLKVLEIRGVRMSRQFSLIRAAGPDPQGAAGVFRRFALSQRASHPHGGAR